MIYNINKVNMNTYYICKCSSTFSRVQMVTDLDLVQFCDGGSDRGR